MGFDGFIASEVSITKTLQTATVTLSNIKAAATPTATIETNDRYKNNNYFKIEAKSIKSIEKSSPFLLNVEELSQFKGGQKHKQQQQQTKESAATFLYRKPQQQEQLLSPKPHFSNNTISSKREEKKLSLFDCYQTQ